MLNSESNKELNRDLPKTTQELRALIAGWLGVPVNELEDDDNLIECGLDSIRIISLLEQFKASGKTISFIELAENPTLAGWETLLVSNGNEKKNN